MGWLAKEVGDRGASGKYFARARGDEGIPIALVLVGLTVVVSLAANFIPPEVIDLYGILALVKPLLAEGELWRLWTVTLVHAPLQQMPLHLVFNAYLLYLAGPFVERMYGRSTFLAFYLLAAAGGSLASFAFSSGPVSVGASGAIFGLFGVMVAVQYVHRPILDQGSRAFLGQAVGLVVLNLILGLVLPSVDNWAHIGGLIAGLLVGVLFAPTRVQSMRSLWMRPGPTPGTAVPVFGSSGSLAIKAMGLGLLGLAYLGLWWLGVAAWS